MEKTVESNAEKSRMKNLLKTKRVLDVKLSPDIWLLFMTICIVSMEILKYLEIRISNLTGIFAIAVVGTTLKNGQAMGVLVATIGAIYTYYYLFISSLSCFNPNAKTSYTIINIIILYGLPIMVGELNKKLIKSEERLRTITDNMTDMICQLDESGVFQYVSPSYKKILGYSPEELLHTSAFDLVSPDDVKYAKEAFEKTLKNYGAKKVEIKAKNKSGQFIWLEVVGDVFYSEQDKVGGAIFSSREITARKKAENALVDSEKKYRLLAENSPLGIAVHQDGKIAYANNAAAQIIGYENAEELIGKSVLNFLHKDYQESAKNRMKEIYGGNTVMFTGEKLVRIDGEIIDVEIMGTPFVCKERPAIQVIVKDITDRKKAEALHQKVLEKQQELNTVHEYDKLKTEFFANISHELRTPLNVILGTLQLLKLYFEDEYIISKNPNVLKHTNIMKQNCLRLLRLVNNIIDATKIDAGFYELHLQDYDIIEIVEKITRSVDSFIESKELELKFATEIEELIIAVDPDKIERILLNLLSNSVKFTPPGGQIKVYISQKENYVRIKVADTGIGISKEKIADLFQRFHQVDKSLTRNHEGSGIGLSLVHSLVSMHGGHITVNSEYNKGTEFIIDLPIRRVDMDSRLKESDVEYSARTERIHVEFSDIYS